MDHQAELEERAKENRAAWGMYAAAYISGRVANDHKTAEPKGIAERAAEYATEMLRRRIQHFR